jgi:hypothetical protein
VLRNEGAQQKRGRSVAGSRQAAKAALRFAPWHSHWTSLAVQKVCVAERVQPTSHEVSSAASDTPSPAASGEASTPVSFDESTLVSADESTLVSADESTLVSADAST